MGRVFNLVTREVEGEDIWGNGSDTPKATYREYTILHVVCL